ncbi:venom metalloproteinase BumaMPs1-like isoform X2 [Dermacentor variabilis]|uniref:venom metalloproteinase BumaMPs1-like isoform X2 n=1 Tax=Dermacentor variabilis TaxID=34621 RepID=UPI003F5C5674
MCGVARLPCSGNQGVAEGRRLWEGGVLVYPKLLESRTHSSGLVLHVHPGLTLTLEKSSVLAKELYFASSTFKNTHRATLNGKELEKNLYHNNEHMASLVVKRVRGSVEVRGILSHQHGIAPVVAADNTISGDIPHRIFDVQERSSSSFNAKNHNFTQKRDLSGDMTGSTEQQTGKQYQPKLFIVETCILTSTNYTRSFNTTEELLMYLAATLNAVALRFSEMVCPTIKFQLNSVLEVPDEKVFGNSTCGKPKNKFTNQEGTVVCGFDAEETLNKTIDYVNACESAACDIVYHITSAELTFVVNGTFSTDITGLAVIGGACTDQRFGVGEDKPRTYLGLTTMAHEFGHLLGAYHDGSSEASTCPAAFGNLMSTMDRGMLNGSKLSPCSQDSIRAFVSNLSATCINISIAGNYTNESYPGEGLTAEEYCKILYPEHKYVQASNNDDGDECEVKCCWSDNLSMMKEITATYTEESTSEGNYDYYYANAPMCRYFPILDGMTCGENKTCKRGVCGEHDWEQVRQDWQVVSTRAPYR